MVSSRRPSPDSLVETLQERFQLIFDRVVQSIRDYQLDILLFVLLGNGDSRTARLQFDLFLFAKRVVLDHEVELRNVSESILKDLGNLHR